MERVNSHYYICEKGHVTIGQSNRKVKCDQKVKQIKLVKKGKTTEKEVIKETICGAEIKEVFEIPEALDLTEKWDYKVIKAFMIGQTPENLKIKFIECLQKHFTDMFELVTELQEGLNEVIKNQKE